MLSNEELIGTTEYRTLYTRCRVNRCRYNRVRLHICVCVCVCVCIRHPCDKWVPVTTAWRVLRLRMEERPPIWRVAANILNKQSRTADKGCSSSLGVGRGANNSSLLKRILLRNIHRQSLGPGLILWYDLRSERGT